MDYGYMAKVSAETRAGLRAVEGPPDLVGKLLAQCVVTEAVCEEAADLLAACEAMISAVDGSHAQVMVAVGRMRAAVAKAKGGA